MTKPAPKAAPRKSNSSPAARPTLYPIPRPGRRQLVLLVVTATLLATWLIALVWLAWHSLG